MKNLEKSRHEREWGLAIQQMEREGIGEPDQDHRNVVPRTVARRRSVRRFLFGYSPHRLGENKLALTEYSPHESESVFRVC